jgi:diguanylate cyclase (GGDEF)-like protein/PAS domain S-box-containing protein
MLIFIPVLWLYGRECLRRKAVQRQQRVVDIRMTCLLGTLSEGVLILNAEGSLMGINPAAEKLLGYEADELVHQPLEMLMPSTAAHSADKHGVDIVQNCLAKGIPVQVEEQPLLARDGVIIPVFFSVAPLLDERSIGGAVVTFQALSEKKDLQNKLKMMATLDPVTGVKNRWETERYLSLEMARARRHQRPLAVLMVAIDHFKRINDTYGPHNGDTVLRAACDAMTGMLRVSDIVGRFSGEAFLVVLPETELGNALILAERLREAIAGCAVPLDGDRAAYFTISLGAAGFPESGGSADALIQAADLSLYKAKNMGPDCVVHGQDASIQP